MEPFPLFLAAFLHHLIFPAIAKIIFAVKAGPFLEVIFCSHLCPPLHSSNNCRGLYQPECDNTDFSLGQSVADTYTISGIVKISEYLCKKRERKEIKKI
jgi:hypothetical protein